MKVINPSIEILTPIDPPAMLARLERAGRICYKSESHITSASASKFVRSLVKSGHHSVIEHESISVRLICDRGVSHELVRHRLASYSQESQRYVNYKHGIEVIKPLFFAEASYCYNIWHKAMLLAEEGYLNLLKLGASPQEARTVLPNSTKTEVVMTANLREWRHVLSLRCSPAAHPQIRELMGMVRDKFQELLPEVFENHTEHMEGNK